MAVYLPYDWDALAAAPHATAWLELLIDQAIAREAITVPEIEALQALAASTAEFDALRAAFTGTAFDIPATMNDAWDTLESLLRRVPSPQTFAFAQKLRTEGGHVGYDDDDNLVWTLPGGGVDVLVRADGKPGGAAH